MRIRLGKYKDHEVRLRTVRDDEIRVDIVDGPEVHSVIPTNLSLTRAEWAGLVQKLGADHSFFQRWDFDEGTGRIVKR